MPWWLLKIVLPGAGFVVVIIAFNLWLGDVKDKAYERGKEDTIAELNAATEELKQEHAEERQRLRQELREQEAHYAQEISEYNRQIRETASRVTVCFTDDTRRVLNDRTARTNSDIEEASAGVDVPLPGLTPTGR